MALRLRMSRMIGFRYLHVRLNVTRSGLSSWSVKVGPWSWNARTRQHRLNLPGPLYWQSAPKRRKRRGKAGGGEVK